MSDDDGMLLNFVTDGSSVEKSSNSSKITGGRWKDRRKLRMAMKVKTDGFSKRKDDGSEQLSSNRNKRLKKESNQMSNTTSMTNGKTREIERKLVRESKKVPTAPPSDQIISSLFTSNREITTSVNTNVHDDSTSVDASNAPLAGDVFETLGVSEILVNHLKEKMRIQKPTSIQKLVIPRLIHNKKDNDLFIHAQTGSGKTLAYLLPVISAILNMQEHVDRKSGCFGIVIAPTRELATQIYQVALMLTTSCHYIVPCLLIGGERKKSEKARLRKGSNIIIGTPGRILDHLENTKVITAQLGSSLRYVILDEGDKLMELGFEETLTKIIQILHGIPTNTTAFPKLPSRIVHVLCSATTSGSVKKLGNVALKNYELISNGKKGGKDKDNLLTAVPDQLLQKITIVPPKLRLVTLGAALSNITKEHNKKEEATTRTMVFLSCSDSVEFHYEAFSTSDSNHRNLVSNSVRLLTRGNTIFPCFTKDNDPNVLMYKLHGSLSQQTRSATLKHFATDNDNTKGKHLIMFCTDVASRGLDLPHVGTVIELDPPFSVEDHLHRIGRTARAGRSGESLLFLLPGEEEGYMDLIKQYHPMGWKLIKFDESLLKPAFSDMVVGRSDLPDKKHKEDKTFEWDTNATTWHLNIERRVLEDAEFKETAIKGYNSHIRAYTTHVSTEKKYFNVKCLHLGHLAKTFGLRERPKVMGQQTKNHGKDSNKKPGKEDHKNKMWRIARTAVRESASEFNY